MRSPVADITCLWHSPSLSSDHKMLLGRKIGNSTWKTCDTHHLPTCMRWIWRNTNCVSFLIICMIRKKQQSNAKIASEPGQKHWKHWNPMEWIRMKYSVNCMELACYPPSMPPPLISANCYSWGKEDRKQQEEGISRNHHFSPDLTHPSESAPLGTVSPTFSWYKI